MGNYLTLSINEPDGVLVEQWEVDVDLDTLCSVIEDRFADVIMGGK